jgi:DNA-binding MarR family transcriptional regulator
MLEQWQRERPEIEAERRMSLVPRVTRLAHLYDAETARVSRSFDLKPGWLDVLSALRRIGPPFRMSASELARWVLLSSGGMTSRLDRMEDAGLVKRQPDPSDRRAVLIELTPRGREIIDAAIDARLALFDELVAGALTDDEQQQFIELTRKQTLAFEEGRIGRATQQDASANKRPD